MMNKTYLSKKLVKSDKNSDKKSYKGGGVDARITQVRKWDL